jgi:hypothetical protein
MMEHEVDKFDDPKLGRLKSDKFKIKMAALWNEKRK